MRIRTFIVAYALILAILLFADRRPRPAEQPRYSHVVDLTDGQTTQFSAAQRTAMPNAGSSSASASAESQTRIVAPDALIPGTWTAGQIPPERLIVPLVVMDLDVSAADSQISLEKIAAWEAQHGVVPQGAVVAIRCASPTSSQLTGTGQHTAGPGSSRLANLSPARPFAAFPITAEAAQFLMDARYTTGFAIETQADFRSDRTLSRQIALHGNYVVEGASHLGTLPATGSLIIVAPGKTRPVSQAPVRVLAMVR